MKNRKITQRLLIVPLLILSVILTSSLGASTALAACGGATNVATENELNAAIADFNSQTTACSYMIALTADIDLTASTTEINNGNANVDLLIDGAGFAVDGQRNSGVRPFKIAANTVVEMRDLTVTGGQVASYADHGGGILNNGGTLTLTTVTLTGNDAAVSATGLYLAWGGGLYNNGGIVTFQNNSLISNNEGEFGGGIYNANGGTVNIYDSTVTGNTSLGGGGVYNEDGLLNIDGSSFSGNDGSGGGNEIESADRTVINNSQFTGVGTSDGAPIDDYGTLTIRNSTISGYTGSTVRGPIVVGSSRE